MNNLNIILDLLKRIQNGERTTYRGICTNITYLLLEEKEYVTYEDRLEAEKVYFSFIEWLDTNVKRWEKFSGKAIFPVPGPNTLSPEAAFWNIENKWEGEYGDNRKELLQWCIDEISKELGE